MPIITYFKLKGKWRTLKIKIQKKKENIMIIINHRGIIKIQKLYFQGHQETKTESEVFVIR